MRNRLEFWRCLGCLALLLLLLAPTAGAQVATPRIIPAAPSIGDPLYNIPTTSIVPANPAALQWGSPSMWAIGDLSISMEQTSPEPSSLDSIPDEVVEAKELAGLFVGGRQVTPDLSVAAELLEFVDHPREYPLLVDWTVLRTAVSFQSGESIAFGLGLDRAKVSQGYSPYDMNTMQLGLSYRFSQTIAVGFVQGSESIATTGQNSDRVVQRYGIGYLSGGESAKHLEYYREDRKEAKEYSTQSEFSGMVTDVIVAEINFGGFVAGAMASVSEKDNSNEKLNLLAFDLGWAPKRGLSLTAHQETGNRAVDSDYYSFSSTSATPITYKIKTKATSISIAYKF